MSFRILHSLPTAPPFIGDDEVVFINDEQKFYRRNPTTGAVEEAVVVPMSGYAVDEAGNARGPDAVDLQYQRASDERVASGEASSIAGGANNMADGDYAHVAGGAGNEATGDFSFASGAGNTASNRAAHATGENTTASGYRSHAEGNETTASGSVSHAEGSGTTASGHSTHAEGYASVAIGYTSHAEGLGSRASRTGQHAYTGVAIAEDPWIGYAQGSRMTLGAVTSDATPAAMLAGDVWDGGDAETSLENDRAYAFRILCVAKEVGGTDVAGYQITGLIARGTGAASVAFVGTPTVTVLGESDAAWDCGVVANTSDGSLDVVATGKAATTIRWHAVVEWSEVLA